MEGLLDLRFNVAPAAAAAADELDGDEEASRLRAADVGREPWPLALPLLLPAEPVPAPDCAVPCCGPAAGVEADADGANAPAVLPLPCLLPLAADVPRADE